MQQGKARNRILAAYCLLMCQARSQAPRAYLQFLCLTADANLDRLEVRVPSPFGFIVGMTHIIAHVRPLTTYVTDSRHFLISLYRALSLSVQFHLTDFPAFNKSEMRISTSFVMIS